MIVKPLSTLLLFYYKNNSSKNVRIYETDKTNSYNSRRTSSQ